MDFYSASLCARDSVSYDSNSFRRFISWLNRVGAENYIQDSKGLGCLWKLVELRLFQIS